MLGLEEELRLIAEHPIGLLRSSSGLVMPSATSSNSSSVVGSGLVLGSEKNQHFG